MSLFSQLSSLHESFTHVDVRRALAETSFKKGDVVQIVGHPEEDGKKGTIDRLRPDGCYAVVTGYDPWGHPLEVPVHPSYLKKVIKESNEGEDISDAFTKGFLSQFSKNKAALEAEGCIIFDVNEKVDFGVEGDDFVCWLRGQTKLGSVKVAELDNAKAEKFGRLMAGRAKEVSGRFNESVKGKGFIKSLRESRLLREGSGNKWVSGRDFYKPLLVGVKKIFPKAYIRKEGEIVIPAESEEKDTGLHLEAWSDCVYVVADCADPAIYGETVAQKKLPEVEFDPKDQWYFLRSLNDKDWETLGELAAKVVKSKGISLKESVKSSGRKSLRESWMDVKKITPEEAVAEVAEGLRSLDYKAFAEGRTITLEFEDLNIKIGTRFTCLDCCLRVLPPEQASSLIFYWVPEGTEEEQCQYEQILGWFDWRTAMKGAYVINGKKLAVHLGRDGGAARIREILNTQTPETQEAKKCL